MGRWALPQEGLGFLKGKDNVRVECHSAKLSAEEGSQRSPLSSQYCLQTALLGPLWWEGVRPGHPLPQGTPAPGS